MEAILRIRIHEGKLSVWGRIHKTKKLHPVTWKKNKKDLPAPEINRDDQMDLFENKEKIQ